MTLKELKKYTRVLSKQAKGDLTKIGKGTFRRTKEDLSMHLWKPLHTKVPIDDLCREFCIGPQIQIIEHKRLILATTKEILLKEKECLIG